MTKEGETIIKKKRAMMQKKKKIEMKPTLVVTKTDGEYKVQMEVFRKYSKERFVNQYPYDEKPPLIYTIGKTEETKRKEQKQLERLERRENRRKARLLQSTFRDKCQEICVKAYNQAIGVLPLPNPNNPECPCDVPAVKEDSTPIIDSCSCSDDTISSSDTDGDDWVIEFTPPVARWNAKVKPPPLKLDNETQYTYLDYKVKLFDKSGNPVPRFFKGPDGKEECSDLGGFWSPNKLWLEINKDGYIGPDGRWVPNNFIGVDGAVFSSEDGVYQDPSGRVCKIGIDGYIGANGEWCYYSKGGGKAKNGKSMSTMTGAKGKVDVKGKAVSQSKSPPGGKPTATPAGQAATPAGQTDQGTGSAVPKKPRSTLQTRPNFDFLVNGKYDYKGKHPAQTGAAMHEKCLIDEKNAPHTFTAQPIRYQTKVPPVVIPAKEPPPPPPPPPPKEAPKENKELQPVASESSPRNSASKGPPSNTQTGGSKASKLVMSMRTRRARENNLTGPRQKPLTYLHGRADRWKSEPQRIAKYNEIMRFGKYDELAELRPPSRTSRASNTFTTPRRKVSPFTMDSYKNHALRTVPSSGGKSTLKSTEGSFRT